MKYLKQNKGKIGLAAALLLMSIGLQILAPKLLSSFIDNAEGEKPMKLVVLIIMGYLITVLLQKAAEVIENYISSSIGWNVTNQLRHDMIAHYIRVDMKQHESWSSGEMMTRLDEDVEGVFQYYFILFLKIGASSILLAGVLTVMAAKNIWLGVIMFSVSLLTIWLFKMVSDMGTKRYLKSNAATAEFNSLIKDKLDNVVELHLGSAEQRTLDEIKTAMRKRFHQSLPAGMMYGNLWSTSTVMEIISKGVTLTAAALLWDKGIITLGTAYLLYSYVDLIYNPLQEFRSHLGGLQDAKAKKQRVQQFISIPSYLIEGKAKMPEYIQNIEVEQLSFDYDTDKEVLHNISFSINAGEHIGIMGETGCGKTTLVKLLARLYEFNTGSIRINGTEIREYDLAALKKKIVYCPQKTQLMHATLRDNITIYDRNISDASILKAIDQLKLSGWYNSLEHGLDTKLEAGEGSISSGEAQFVSVIRLFLREPELVIMDEISSNLDHKTEEKLMMAIKTLTMGRTVITIAHHLSALEWVNKIIVLEQGKLIEQGRRDALQADSHSNYFALWKKMQEKGGTSS